jgi:hypothetical protein
VATSSALDTTSGAVDVAGSTAWTTGSVSILAGSVFLGTWWDENHTSGSTITAPSIEALDWGDSTLRQTTGYRIEASAGSYAVAGTWAPALPVFALRLPIRLPAEGPQSADNCPGTSDRW